MVSRPGGWNERKTRPCDETVGGAIWNSMAEAGLCSKEISAKAGHHPEVKYNRFAAKHFGSGGGSEGGIMEVPKGNVVGQITKGGHGKPRAVGT